MNGNRFSYVRRFTGADEAWHMVEGTPSEVEGERMTALCGYYPGHRGGWQAVSASGAGGKLCSRCVRQHARFIAKAREAEK